MPTFTDVAIVGMHFRGEQIKSLVASLQPPFTLELEREPENPYDQFDIKALYNGIHIGYVERGQAAFISHYIDEGNPASCSVHRMEKRKNNIHPICSITV